MRFPLIPLPNKEATQIAYSELNSGKFQFPLIPLPNKEATLEEKQERLEKEEVSFH